jgi:dihydroxyacetone kinase-like protein
VNGSELTELLIRTMAGLEASREELRELDAAIGDGDLGITVAGGAAAVAEMLSTAAGTLTEPAQILKAVARTFSNANPSTMSGLVAAALLAGSREVGPDVDRAAGLRLLEAAATVIQARGGAQLGDKTILDALVPSIEVLRVAPEDDLATLQAMAAAARTGVQETAGLQSQRGRAAWVGARSIGHADGGATAYLRLLESLATAWPAS